MFWNMKGDECPLFFSIVFKYRIIELNFKLCRKASEGISWLLQIIFVRTWRMCVAFPGRTLQSHSSGATAEVNITRTADAPVPLPQACTSHLLNRSQSRSAGNSSCITTYAAALGGQKRVIHRERFSLVMNRPLDTNAEYNIDNLYRFYSCWDSNLQMQFFQPRTSYNAA